FAIFLVPVVLRQIGPWIFILSGVASLVFITLFLLLIRYSSAREFGRGKIFLFGSIAGIFALVNILYFTGLIPPLPLSLKDAGVYYSVKRQSDGNYLAKADEDFGKWYSLYPDFHKLPGQPIYVYSAVFSPAAFNMDIVHQWQHYN